MFIPTKTFIRKKWNKRKFIYRLWEKNHHQSSHSISSTCSTPPNKSSIILEPIAKDLPDEDAHSDQGLLKLLEFFGIY